MYDKDGRPIDVYALIEMLFKHTAGTQDFARKAQVLNESGRSWKHDIA